MKIGDIEIPIVSNIEELNDNSVDEFSSLPSYNNDVDNVAVKHNSSIKYLIFTCYLNKEIHSQKYSLTKQKDRVKNLRKRDAIDNDIDVFGYSGHLMVDEVDLTDNAESIIINEVVIRAFFLPWPEYYSSNDPSS